MLENVILLTPTDDGHNLYDLDEEYNSPFCRYFVRNINIGAKINGSHMKLAGWNKYAMSS